MARSSVNAEAFCTVRITKKIPTTSATTTNARLWTMVNELLTAATPGRLSTADARSSASTPSTALLMRDATVAGSSDGSGSASTREGETAIASGFLTRVAISKVVYETKIAGWTLKRAFCDSPTMRIG